MLDKTPSGMRTSHSRVPESKAWLHYQFQHPVNARARRQQIKAEGLGSLLPKLNSAFLALIWSGPNCCTQLEDEPTREQNHLFICPSNMLFLRRKGTRHFVRGGSNQNVGLRPFSLPVASIFIMSLLEKYDEKSVLY